MTAGDDAARAAGTGDSAGRGEPLLDLLRRDHREILDLFDRVAECGKGELDKMLSLFNRIEEGVQRHFEGEERFLYTALEQHEEARGLVLESYELHRVATFTIGGFKALALDDERWRPKALVLRRLVEVHVELQEKDLFPVALRVLGEEQLRGIEAHFVGVRSGSDPHRAGLDAPK
ncbi:hemerythrin domain-containing protein [Geomonas sp. RF6]|uniref:hemerythrin domain-containing protein n=1 Tax=Geomonas sp. RF6 TaxID=2897342 RepID=UPI001E2C10B2|nr:hemerythrin domain-containing protein [Geomonas sp. RF6]UFS71739.1 hemerythrin domain-containing protein [Geomonas sp. RF6]